METAQDNRVQPRAASRAKTIAMWLIVIASLAWTAWNWDGLFQIRHRLSEIGIFAGLLVFTEACFILGAILVASGLGKSVFAGSGLNPFMWVKAIVHVRGAYHDMAFRISESTMFRIGFNLNWFGAIGTGIVAAVGIAVVLPSSAWGIMVLPLLDIAASIGWRLPVDRKLREIRGASVQIRYATLADVPALVALDAERYEEISQAETNDPDGMFRARIENSPGWFWVAEQAGRVIGLLSVAPVAKNPEEFTSWDDSTANGTLDGVVDPDSPYVYVVAMTTEDWVASTSIPDRLYTHALGRAMTRGTKLAYFAGRMPGYYRYAEQMSPQEYYDARVVEDGKSVAFDRQIRRYETWGMKRTRLVKDGFVEDWKSAGYGVLFQLNLPLYGSWLAKPMGGFLAWTAQHARVFALVKRYL